MTTFTKLTGNQGWGIRAREELEVGTTTTVEKRNGDAKQVTVGALVEHQPAGKYPESWVYAIGRGASENGNGQSRTIRVEGPGVFENDEGIFVVKPNRAGTRLYAKRLVELGPDQGDRLNVEDAHVRFQYEYANGAVYRLREEDRMDLDRAKSLAIRYGRCINCNAKLEVAESIERGLGPVCAKRFRQP